MTAPFRILVTGSRSWTDTHTITAVLDVLHQQHGPALTVVHGACPKGADTIADRWCQQHGVPVERHPADWTVGRGAGMHRNAAMVATGPDLCLAFIRNQSAGATHCANLAEQAGIRTLRNPSPLLVTALSYADRGWHVFPLRTGDKRPAVRDWERRATIEPERIIRCWSANAYGIGIACGPSGLIVIDLDVPKHGNDRPPAEWARARHGRDVFTTLAHRHAAGIEATYTVITGSGGCHLYYQHPDTGPALRNTAGERGGIGWKVDTRAAGGYVVAAGSTVAGRRYEVALECEPAPLPEWLTELLQPAPLPAAGPVRVELPGDRRGNYLRAAVERQVAYVTSATSGRNHALYMAAQALGQLVAGGALDQAYVEAVLTDAARTVGLHLDPPAGQIPKTIRSGLRAGARRPRSVAA